MDSPQIGRDLVQAIQQKAEFASGQHALELLGTERQPIGGGMLHQVGYQDIVVRLFPVADIVGQIPEGDKEGE